MYILTKQATDSLNNLLHLPATGSEQDWDIELADPTRIDEFLAFFRKNLSLGIEQKCALMALIIASCEDRLQNGESLNPDNWADISFRLQNDFIYKNLIDYWSLKSEQREEDLFAMTPLIRSVLIKP